ncbi:MAG: TolC family protein [Muribaculaceae bacterium]|nr:TolC family protein [Muribaculaceae bacterium]
MLNRLKAGILTAVLPLMAASAQTVPSLSLDDCLTIAMSGNPTVKVADMEVRRLDYSKKEVIGQLLPSIDFGVNYNRMVAKQVMYMNMDGFGGLGGGSEDTDAPADAAGTESSGRSSNSNGIKMGLDNSWQLGFSGSLPVIAPQLWKSLSLSDSQILRSVEASRQSKQQLVNQVKSAYYALLLAEDSRKVIQQSYDMAKLTYETYSKQYALGAASDYDVLRTSVAMKNVEPELAQADIAIRRANLQLRVLMGLEPDFEFTVSDKLSNYESTMYESTLAAMNTDISGNADLRLLDIDANITKKNLDIKKLAFSPTLALTANYNWTSMSNGSPFKNFRWNPYSTVGFTLSVPIFQGGRRYSAVRQAAIQLDEIRLQRENLERTVNMQVNLAIDNIKVNVKQIASCSESMKQAERAHTIMERSFDIGAASYLDLRDSELALTRAQLTYYQAIYNYLIAGSELELLQGTADVERYTSATEK